MALAVSLPAEVATSRTIGLARDGLRLEMAPLSLDQVRAFAVARGLSAHDAEAVAATGCIFRSSVGHESSSAAAPALAVRLTEWRVKAIGNPETAMWTRERWDEVLRGRNAAADAAVALHWALVPTEQEYGPSDYNWGFLSFGLPPGSEFDLEIAWHVGGKRHTARFDGLRCGGET